VVKTVVVEKQVLSAQLYVDIAKANDSYSIEIEVDCMED